MYPDFSNKFLLKGNDESEIRSFFKDEIIRFFENNHIYHLESNGESLIVFDKIKLARTDETIAFIKYGQLSYSIQSLCYHLYECMCICSGYT